MPVSSLFSTVTLSNWTPLAVGETPLSVSRLLLSRCEPAEERRAEPRADARRPAVIGVTVSWRESDLKAVWLLLDPASDFVYDLLRLMG